MVSDTAVRELADDYAPEQVEALSDLRTRVRLHRRGNVELGDLMYRIYITVLLGVFGSYIAIGAIDNAPIDAAGIAWFESHGPAWVGLVLAVLLTAGVRSGISGGPLAIDAPDLQHLLLSPLPRSVVLASSVRRLMATAVTVGAVAGLAAGELASRRLPGSQAAWLGAGVLLGLTMVCTAAGSALTASSIPSLRTRPWIAAAVPMGILVWAVLDVTQGWETAPTTAVGRLALWPITFSPVAIAGPVVAATLVAVGWRGIDRLSVERAARRAHLIRQVRFALAQQDIRSLILLRRQLGFERPRRNPLVRIGAGRFEHRAPVVYRDLRSYLRWPLQRVIRVGALTVVAGLALAGMWQGTTAFSVGFAVIAYLTSLEVVEPFAQELDHGVFLGSAPVTGATVLVGHLAMATGLMSLLGAVTAAVAGLAAGSTRLVEVVAIALIPGSAAAVGGAAISTRRVGNGGSDTAMFMPDEMAGPAALVRLVWPIALAGLGVVPVLFARSALNRGESVVDPAIASSIAIAVVATAMFGWIRYRDDFSRAMTEAQSTASSSKN